jgi:hypothetical protein
MDPNDSIYWNNVRDAAQKARAAGFVNCDSLSYLRNHTSTDVMNSLNRGAGIVMYRGSAVSTWYMPFDHVQPGHLTSTNKLPIILAVTCQTMTLDPYDPPMYGDSFMRAGTLSNLVGGVAYFGNTLLEHYVANVRSAVSRGFFDAVFTQNTWKLGKAMLCAKHELYLEFPGYPDDYRGFSLLGDPDLGIWTATPRTLTVEHPTDIVPGLQQVHVTVSSDSMPIQGALVCASMDTTVYVSACTDSTGAVDLTVNPPDTGHIRIVVTGQNLYPYDGYIHVIATAVAEPAPSLPCGVCDLTASPALVTRTCRFTWNSVLTSPARLFVYDASGRLAQSAICNLKSEIALDFYGQRAGVYLAVLRNQFGNTIGRTRVTKLN